MKRCCEYWFHKHLHVHTHTCTYLPSPTRTLCTIHTHTHAHTHTHTHTHTQHSKVRIRCSVIVVVWSLSNNSSVRRPRMKNKVPLLFGCVPRDTMAPYTASNATSLWSDSNTVLGTRRRKIGSSCCAQR